MKTQLRRAEIMVNSIDGPERAAGAGADAPDVSIEAHDIINMVEILDREVEEARQLNVTLRADLASARITLDNQTSHAEALELNIQELQTACDRQREAHERLQTSLKLKEVEIEKLTVANSTMQKQLDSKNKILADINDATRLVSERIRQRQRLYHDQQDRP